MKKISVFLLLIACPLILSGCWDKHEIEDNTFAVLLGIDLAESEDVIVTIAFPLTQTEGGEDVKGGDYTTMSVKAPTVAEAFHLFGMKLSGPLAFYSVKTIVVSRELAQSDMLSQVFSSWRYEEIRNTTGVLVSECKAAEWIKARITDSPIDPLRQEELLLEQANESAYYQPIQLLVLLTNLKSNSGDGVAMYGGIAAKSEDDGADSGQGKQNGGEDKGGADIKEATKDGYLPSEVPVSAENESRISGLAVFRGAKLAGVLNSAEAQTYSMLTQNGVKELLTVPDPLAPQHEIVIEILPHGKNKIDSEIRGETPVFNISTVLKCSIESVPSGIDYTVPENHRILTAHIEDVCTGNMKKLIAKVQKEYHADILKLGDKLAYHFRTAGEWQRYDWPQKYPDAEINLRVSVDVKRSGMMAP